MKYSVPVFLATAAYAVAAFMPDLNNATLAETPVIVKVTCDGVDFTKLSLIADTLGGNFLEASYNNVHSSADNDDSELNSLTYNGSGNTFGWNFRSSNYGVWKGQWGCRVCPNDESDAFHSAWENQFVAALLESTHPGFKEVKTCKIVMNPGSRDAGNDANVDVDVTCKNKDFTKLSVSQGTYLAHAVQVSYNKVHGDAANDDSVLDKVFFYAIKKNTKEEANRLGLIHHVSLGLSGWWGCRLCPRHDDFMIDAVADSGEALKAWEAALVVTLKQSPFEYFNNIQTCDIKLRPHSLAQEADVEGSSTLGGLVTNE